MKQLLTMAYRGLGRNRRRSFLSALALGLGVALLLMMAAFVEGEMRNALALSIRLESGHLQVRARGYDGAATSLAWEDLVDDPMTIAGQIAALEPVRTTTPRLYASGILLSGDESLGVRILGIDPASGASAVYQELLDGAWLDPDDREGVLIGAPLAAKRNLAAGDRVTLLVNTANGDIDEQPFVVRGVYTTHTPTHDQRTVLMPLSKAQAITQVGDRASVVWVELDDMFQAEAVAAALISDRLEVQTWQQMNALYLEVESYANAMMAVFYVIVLAITATVVVNAMVMAVFERTREIGILAAIGMKERRILALFLTEAFLLALGGVGIGLLLGGLGVYYLSAHGVYLGNMVADMGLTGFVMGDRIYGYLTARDAVTLIVAAFVVTLLASLYPAILAARMEPVRALHGGEAG